MQPQTFIFWGPSGSGKGTQAKLLIDKLKEKSDMKVCYLETGQKFREFALESSFASKLTKNILDEGGLMPEFMPIWIWTEYLVRHVSGEEHLILDGVSRRAPEAPVLDSAIKFFQRKNPIVVSIEVSDDWSRERLSNRGRHDDNKLDIDRRISWFHENTKPAIEFFKNNKDYTFLSINGERSIEEVHADIVSKLGL